MNLPSQNASNQHSASQHSADAETTLRLIANLPAPRGLEDRVITGLRAAPRGGRILSWPSALRPSSGTAGNWMRSAAAAAIVFVVAGGGWGVYTRVQPNQPARVIVMPQRMAAPGGFSSAGAMRTPQTLDGPVLVQPPAAQAVAIKPAKKAPARMPLHRPQSLTTDKAAVQPAQPQTK
jgi:hypothetical protein